MKIKERDRSSLFTNLKKILKISLNVLFNKKTKFLFGIILILILFFIGIIFGLLISGFFGTFDQPSQKAIDFLHVIGITDLRGIKLTIEGVLSENIKIPVNYIKGKLSKPEKIYIDIAFTDFQKIEYKRQQALEQGILISSADDYVPADIRYGDKILRARVRLKGDWTDHLEGNKWSFRIKIRGNDTLFGMKTLSIQDPKTRNYLYEWFYLKILKKEDVVAPRYEFVEVVINGDNKGIYALEEHFEKELIENNNRREGVIIKFNEDAMWEETLRVINYSNLELLSYDESKFTDFFYNSEIDTFDNEGIIEDPALSKQFIAAKNLLESFREGSLKASEVFDTDVLARYFAITTVTKAWHAAEWHNIRLYYNPLTSKLEPIGFDADISDRESMEQVMEKYLPDCVSYDVKCSQEIPSFHELLFRDQAFFEKYMKELERVSERQYMNELLNEFEKEIDKNKNIIHKDYLLNYFGTDFFYKNQEAIKSSLSPTKAFNAYFEENVISENKLKLSLGNAGPFPLEIIGVTYNNSETFDLAQSDNLLQPKKSYGNIEYKDFDFLVPAGFSEKEGFSSLLKVDYKIVGTNKTMQEEVFPWKRLETGFSETDFIRQDSNIANFDFLVVDNEKMTILIKPGAWTFNQSLITPKGYTLMIGGGTTIDLVKNSLVVSYAPIQFIGTKTNPIKITSSDKTGQGLVILNAIKESNLEHVYFSDLTNPNKENWELTGAITFYKSPFNMNNVVIKNMQSEDSLDGVDSRYVIKNSFFENCFSDCLDDDFGGGIIEDTSFINCGNDCLDVSGAKVEVNNLKIFHSGDKGISGGEKSDLLVKNIEINSDKTNFGFIGIASKDQSQVYIENASITNYKYGLAAYRKKPEFGPANIEANQIKMVKVNQELIIEKNSNILLNGTLVLGQEEGVYDKLYPGG